MGANNIWSFLFPSWANKYFPTKASWCRIFDTGCVYRSNLKGMNTVI
jgi:hypothetical protein